MSTTIYKKENYWRKSVTILKADGDKLDKLCKCHNVSFSTLAYTALQEYVLRNFGITLSGNSYMQNSNDIVNDKDK